MLLATAVLYLWNLGASGWANAFYSAAAQAGSQNWAAWFFGSSDAANSITVDKPPASLWIMGLSVRIFGLSSWSILVPEALMGVATAWLLYLAVRRAAAPATGDPRLAHRAGLLAAVVMAITPVATLMFRFNNPDALLVLLMTAAGYATLRSIQDNKLRWLLLAGVFLGFGFLTKQLQVLLVVPGFAVAYVVAAPGGVGRRLLRLLAAGAAMVVSAGWWLAVVELVPANMRPYIGGSQNNSILELTLGYNGLGRLSGQETGSVGGGNGWGVPGLFRMFNSEFGGQIAWLLPSVLVLGAGLLWLGRRAPRTDCVRASVIVWGSWVLVTGLVFSFMAGIIHPYYAVALAPGIAGLAGLGGALLWQHRAQLVAAVMLAVAVAAAGFTGLRPPGQHHRVWSVAALGGAVGRTGSRGRAAALGTLPVPHPSAHDGGARPRGLPRRPAGVLDLNRLRDAQRRNPQRRSHDYVRWLRRLRRPGRLRARPPNNAAQNTPPQALQQPGAQGGGFGGNRQGGGMGGLLGATTPSSEMVAALKSGASNYTWAAAVVGSNNAAGYQLATELPVMAVGGFNGTDPSPTLEQFQQLVAQGKIHYFIAGGTMQANSGSEAPAQIAQWVAANFQSQTIGGTTVYALAG